MIIKTESFLLILMKDITCTKTIESTNESIKNIKATLRNLTEN